MVNYITIILMLVMVTPIFAENQMVFERKSLGLRYEIKSKNFDIESSLDNLQTGRRVGVLQCLKKCKANISMAYSYDERSEYSEDIKVERVVQAYIKDKAYKSHSLIKHDDQQPQQELLLKYIDQPKKPINIDGYFSCYKKHLPLIIDILRNKEKKQDTEVYYMASSLLGLSTSEGGLICYKYLGPLSQIRLPGLVSNIKLYTVLNQLHSKSHKLYLSLFLMSNDIDLNVEGRRLANNLLRIVNVNVLTKKLIEVNLESLTYLLSLEGWKLNDIFVKELTSTIKRLSE